MTTEQINALRDFAKAVAELPECPLQVEPWHAQTLAWVDKIASLRGQARKLWSATAGVPVTADGQLVLDSGLNYYAAVLIAESTRLPRAQQLLEELGNVVAIDFDDVRIVIEAKR